MRALSKPRLGRAAQAPWRSPGCVVRPGGLHRCHHAGGSNLCAAARRRAALNAFHAKHAVCLEVWFIRRMDRSADELHATASITFTCSMHSGACGKTDPPSRCATVGDSHECLRAPYRRCAELTGPHGAAAYAQRFHGKRGWHHFDCAHCMLQNTARLLCHAGLCYAAVCLPCLMVRRCCTWSAGRAGTLQGEVGCERRAC